MTRLEYSDDASPDVVQLEIIPRPDIGPGALCAWCNEPIPMVSPDTGRKVRVDARTCSKRCRQSSWRFGRPASAGDVGRVDPGRPRRFAYADPPYPGFSARYYGDHPDFAGEVDHRRLLEQLNDGYPDGWALSTSSKTLKLVLALCPDDVRIGAWTKPMPPGKALRARVAWEPVIFHGGRPRADDARTLLDWVHAAPPRTFPGQVVGTKPSRFAWWVFDCLGAIAGDELVDLFPGSGAIGVAWDRYQAEASRLAGAA